MPVSIVTDSVASLPKQDLGSYGIDVVSLYVNDGETNAADVDLDPEEFYRRLGDMAHLPTSSQPSVESLLDAFRGPLQRGNDVVGVFISERMSGTLETARMAAEMVRAEYPGATIELVDSHSNSMEEGMAAEAAARAAQAGESAKRCAEVAVETRKRTRYLFTPETLEYLRRGGRIGAASALVGGLLQIKPILTVNDEGVTDVWARVRTRQRAHAQIAAQLSADAERYGLVEVVVHYIGDRGPAEAFARDHVEPISGVAPRVIPVSPVIGVHVGPAVGIVYRTEREMRG